MSSVLNECASRKGQCESYDGSHLSSPELGSQMDWSDEGPGDFVGQDTDEHLLLPAAEQTLSDLDDRGAVEAWRVTALGRRPQDYLARDLLLNSLWRDERPRVFHDLAKKPPVWIEDHVRHFPGTHVKQAAQLTVLHYLHRRQLAQLRTGDVADEVIGPTDRNLITRLWDCWPYGAKMIPSVTAQAPPHGCWCRLAWLCPWCYARRAVGLDQLLREGPLRNPQGKHLVLAWISTFGEQASPDPVWQDRWDGRYGTHYLQGPRKIRAMRSAVTARFRHWARELGITGGIITHQISPWNTQDYRKGVQPGLASFRHDFAMLGEVTFSHEDQADLFRDKTAYRTYPYGSININHPDLADCYKSPSVFWSFHAADDPKLDALRLFLAGSSADYPVARLQWHVGGLTDCRLTRTGIRGALALQPHFMMDEVQWWSYVEATRGLPLYVPFGSWRAAIGEAKTQRTKLRQTAVLLPSPQRKAAFRRKQVLKNANSQRRQHAQAELDRFIEVARPLLKQAMLEQSGTRGRPAHRARLKELLVHQGFSVSEHHLKQIVRVLRS